MAWFAFLRRPRGRSSSGESMGTGATDAERRFRIEQETAVLLQRGYETGEARLRATEMIEEYERAISKRARQATPLANLSGSIRDDVRHAVRALRKTPWFSVAVVATLAIGLGATTVIFSLVEALLLRPLPVHEPARLMLLREERRGPNQSTSFGASTFRYDRYRAYREAATGVFADVVAQNMRVFSLRVGSQAIPITGVVTSGNYFQVLGVRPTLGQFYAGVQDEPGGAQLVAVLSYDFFRQSLGGDSAVIGKTLYLDGLPLRVIGVAPAGFNGAFGAMFVPDVWVPEPAVQQAFDGSRPDATQRPSYMWMNVFGRLRDGISAGQALAALQTIGPRVAPEDPKTRIVRVLIDPLSTVTTDIRSGLGTSMLLLFAVAVAVLVIAAANAAGMLLARAMSRRREVATRLALGATRGRLVRQLLVESFLLCAIAGVMGLAVTWWLMTMLNTWEPPFPMRVALGFGVNRSVLSIAAVTVLGTAFLAGMLPALQGTTVNLAAAMKGGALSDGPSRTRLRNVFVVAQVALSMVLLAVAGLITRSLANVLDIDPGFSTARAVHATINIAPHGYDAARGRVFFDQLLARVRARREIGAAAYAADAPLSGNTNTWGAVRVDRPDDAEIDTQWSRAGVGFVELLGVRLLAGRTFTASDRDGTPSVAVINETLAHRLWPGARLNSVVGRDIKSLGERLTIVGVIANGKYMFMQEAARSFGYVPLQQWPSSAPFLYLRARDSTSSALRAAREELSALDPNIALERPTTLAGDIDRYLTPQKAATTIVGVFGLIGLLLAATGLYGLLAYTVAQRQREFGVRIALGARAADVVRLVARQATALVAVGVAVGLAGALLVGGLIARMLFGVAGHDPLTLASTALILLIVAALASAVPARRAARADPMASLRAE